MKPILARPAALGLLTAGLALVPVLVGWRDYRTEARVREAQLFEATSGLVGERLQLMAARHFSAFPIIRNQLRAQGGGRAEPVALPERLRASLPHLSALGYAAEENGRMVLRWLAVQDARAPSPGTDLSDDAGRREVFAVASRQPIPASGPDGEREGALFVAEAVGDTARPFGYVVGWLDLGSLCADPSLPLVNQGVLKAFPGQVEGVRGEAKTLVLGEVGPGVPLHVLRGDGFAAAYGEVTPWVVLVSGVACAALLGFLVSQGARSARLRQALAEERMRVRLVQTFSHEFKTPLSVILSSAELLEAGGERLDQARRGELLGQIRDSTGELSGMVSEMLLLSRLESGMFKPRPEPLELDIFCARLAAEAEAAAGVEKRIIGKVSGQATLDPSLLRAVLGNLLGNALKYSPAHSPVVFNGNSAGTELILTVSDTGIGITPEGLERAGEPFFRASNTGGIPGSGLGLAIARRASGLMGGTLEISSEEGKGTTATLRIPRP